MCYDSDTSRNAFVISMIASAILFVQPRKEFKIIALMSAYIGIMQAFDYVFWTSPPPSLANEYLTKIGAWISYLQPFVLYLLLRVYKGTLSATSTALAWLYFVAVAMYLIPNWTQLKYTTVEPHTSPSLSWKWQQFKGVEALAFFYVIVTFYLVYREMSSPMNVFLILLILGTFGWSYYKQRSKSSTARFWCYYGSFYPVAVIAFNALIS